MINILLFISLAFLFTFLVGNLIERIKAPWIFAALIFGGLIALHNPFVEITTSRTFEFLAKLGMYFLLFIIGFEINLREIRKQGGFLMKATFFIILSEALVGTIFIHFVFGYEWLVSLLAALSFATVGEAILVPILDSFKITNTKLGRAIISIGTLDDIIEIIVLVAVVALIGSSGASSANTANFSITQIFISLFVLFAFTIGLRKFGERENKFKFSSIEKLFLFLLFVLFLFLGVGELADSAPLAAFLAGIGTKTFVPRKRLALIESEIRTISYGFFAPLFFVWAGTSLNLPYLLASPLLLVFVIVLVTAVKLGASFLVGRKELGDRGAFLLGIGLSARFSTSLVVIKLLLDAGLIRTDLYSIILASSVVLSFVIPLAFSALVSKYYANRAVEG
ncbi:cation:proton antiporter [Candidatus Pacearchaeota archaeon]|nr:MAG: cation:proton antiporter [Candidatus Pacearchaeota archaeon]